MTLALRHGTLEIPIVEIKHSLLYSRRHIGTRRLRPILVVGTRICLDRSQRRQVLVAQSLQVTLDAGTNGQSLLRLVIGLLHDAEEPERRNQSHMLIPSNWPGPAE